MDLYQGYYLMPMSKESQSKTAFVYKDELGYTQKYEWTVMPLGLQGAPSSFQDLMDEVMKDVRVFVSCTLMT